MEANHLGASCPTLVGPFVSVESVGEIQVVTMVFRMAPPLVTVRTFCAFWVWSEIFGFLMEFAY